VGRKGGTSFTPFIGILLSASQSTEILGPSDGLLSPGMINFYKAIPSLIVTYFQSNSFETCFFVGSVVTHVRLLRDAP